MLEYLEKELNKTTTLNGADAFRSTESAVLDLFSRASNLRQDMEQLEDLIVKALNENEELALKALFYLSDIRQGQGTRDVMKSAIKVLIRRYPDKVENLMNLIPEFTRWDLMYEFVGTRYERLAFQFMLKEVFESTKTENYLIFKWLKSADATSKETRRLGALTAKYFGLQPRQYRKLLSSGRKKLNLVENNLTHKTYEKINYEQVPSKASLIYRNAFFKHDEERYREYIDEVISGEKKMNMGVTYPHEIVASYRYHNFDPSLEAAWKSLPDYSSLEGNILTVCDVSGSMQATINGSKNVRAMDVSIALAIYTASHIKGRFHNNIITFSERPELFKINDKDSLYDMITRVSRMHWGYNTDIDKVFQLVLDTATQNHINQDEMPNTILIVSDMQFDHAVEGGRNFIGWKKRFEENGYKLPNIVFWNVMDYGNIPVSKNDSGVALISGYSPSILKFIYEGKIDTPYDLMLNVLNQERYEWALEQFNLA